MCVHITVFVENKLQNISVELFLLEFFFISHVLLNLSLSTWNLRPCCSLFLTLSSPIAKTQVGKHIKLLVRSDSAGLCSSEWGSKNAFISGKSVWLILIEEIVMLSSPWIFPTRLNLLLIFPSHYWNLLYVAFEQSRIVVDGLDESWPVKHVAFSSSSVGLQLSSLPGPCAVLDSVWSVVWLGRSESSCLCLRV